MSHSGPCVCTLADLHPSSAGGSGRVACSVGSAGIRHVKQCLEAVLVAFEVAGACNSIHHAFGSISVRFLQGVRALCCRSFARPSLYFCHTLPVPPP
jgi:hypothetical protein